MSLETAFQRLAIRPSKSSICHQCRRSLATSTQRQRASATASFVDELQKSRAQSNTPPTRQKQPQSTPQNTAQHDLMVASVNEATTLSRQQANRTALADLRRSYTRRDLELQVTRRYKPGDVYAPHDLSGAEASKWKKISKKPRPRFDVLDQLGIDPRKHYTNLSMMGEYVTEMGKIRSGTETGLRPVNQRKMAKAIRRAVGVGLLMPGTHKHPENLRLQGQEANRYPM